MAQGVASMAGLRGSSLAVLTPVGNTRVGVTRTGLVVRAQQSESETSRRAVLGLIATGLASGSFVQAVLADAKPIKLGPPPPPSGGLRKSPIFSSYPFYEIWMKLRVISQLTKL